MSKIKKKSNIKWVIQAVVFTFVLSTIFNAGSTIMLEDVSIVVKVIVLLSIIIFGGVVGMIGTAAVSADETPFHSMASRKVNGSEEALFILKHRDKVSNFCWDIIGGVCGIVIGSSSAFLSVRLVEYLNEFHATAITLAVMGAVAAISVGGNAVMTTYAVDRANDIIFSVARIIRVFRRKKKKKTRRSA